MDERRGIAWDNVDEVIHFVEEFDADVQCWRPAPWSPATARHPPAMTTLKDVARATGVDVSTVSRALAGDVRVAPPTRDRIAAAAQALGYRPHEAARRLRQGASKTVWFLTGGLDRNLDRDPVLHGIDHLAAAGYDGLLAIHRGDPAIEDRLLKHLDRGLADGAIVIPEVLVSAGPPNPRLVDLVTRRFPLVFLDRHPPTLRVPTVTTDNVRAVTHLIKAGNAVGVERWVILHQGGDSVADVRQHTAEVVLRAGHRPWADSGALPPGFLQEGRVGVVATSAAKIIAWAEHQGLPPQRMVAAVFDVWPDHQSTEQRPRTVLLAEQDFPAMADRAVELLLDMLQTRTWRDGFHLIPVRGIRSLHAE